MTDEQWRQLRWVVEGRAVEPLPIGFIIDSPWLPNWAGVSMLQYFSSEEVWFEAHRKALERFPSVLFLPGFWSEYGMCTEPSAFGSKCIFHENEFPFAGKVIRDVREIDDLAEPDPATDGLLPLVLQRLANQQNRIEELGHRIRFSISRGPLNIATFLMGTTEFLMALKTDPARIHLLLAGITRFLKKWHALQQKTFPAIEGIFVLDDIVGFIGEADFKEFGLPYLGELFACRLPVKFFHNDAACARSLPFYPGMGINLYNPGVFNSLAELRALSGSQLTILGNIPPRDVLARGTPAQVRQSVHELLAGGVDRTRLILSCAGGMPPGVSTDNIQSFVEAAQGF